MVQNIRMPICRSTKVNCGKTADCIWIPMGVLRGVSRGLGVLDRVVIIEGEGAVFRINLGRPIVTNETFATCFSQITLTTCSRYVIDTLVFNL